MKVIKRTGELVEFDKTKIFNAIFHAMRKSKVKDIQWNNNENIWNLQMISEIKI